MHVIVAHHTQIATTTSQVSAAPVKKAEMWGIQGIQGIQGRFRGWANSARYEDLRKYV